MTFGAAPALVGLLALPVLVWLHRRRRRVPPTPLPSLLFVKDELESRPPRRRLLDVELLLTLLAAAALALAAADPRIALGARGRLVRVVVETGAPADAFAAEHRRALDAVIGALGAADQWGVVPVGTGGARRPPPARLVDAALEGEATGRLVISDAPPPADLPPRVTWIRAGRPGAANVGIVGATVVREEGGARAFATVEASTPGPVDVVVALEDAGGRQGARPLALEAGGAASTTLALPEGTDAFRLVLLDAEGRPVDDLLAADDRVVFQRRPLRVALAADLPPGHREALARALAASLGQGGFVWEPAQADLAVLAGEEDEGPSAPLALRLFPLGSDAGAGTPLAPGPDRALDDPLVGDLSTRGVDLLLAPAAHAADAEALLWREGRRDRPVVARRGATIFFLPDPLAGAASPAATPLWPLFVDNVVATALGERADEGAGEGRGWRRQGLFDRATTALGREATPAPAIGAAIREIPVSGAPRRVDLRLPLALLGLASLLLLWLGGWARARRPAPLAVRSRA